MSQSPTKNFFKVDVAGSPRSACCGASYHYDKLSTSEIVAIVSSLAAERMKTKAFKVAVLLLGALSVVLLGSVCSLSWTVAATARGATQQAHGSMLLASDLSATMASLAAASGLSASTAASSMSTASASTASDSTATAASSTLRTLPELVSSAAASSHGRSLLAMPGFSGSCGSDRVAVNSSNCAQAASWCYYGQLTPTSFNTFRNANIKCQPVNCNNPPTWTSGNLGIQMWDATTSTYYTGTVNSCYSANSGKAFDFCCP